MGDKNSTMLVFVIRTGLSCLSCPVFLSQVTCPRWPVPGVLSWVSCPGCLVLGVLPGCLVLDVLTCLECPVMGVLPRCPVPGVLSRVSCSGCPALGDLSQVSRPRYPFDSPTEPRTTEPRMGLLSEWTQPRMGLNPEWDFCPNGLNPEWDWT